MAGGPIMSTTTKARAVALSTVVALALLTASCGAPSNAPAPTGNSRQTVPTRGPGAQPNPPGGTVSVPVEPALPREVDLPIRTPGDQPVDPGPIVVAPSTPTPTLIPSDTEPTPTTDPSEQLPIPEVP